MTKANTFPNGFRHFYLPHLDRYEVDHFEFDFMQQVRLIVDNRDLSDQRRDELMQLARPLSFGMVLTRITDGEPRPRSKRAELAVTLPKAYLIVR